jgi:hypothetical protein
MAKSKRRPPKRQAGRVGRSGSIVATEAADAASFTGSVTGQRPVLVLGRSLEAVPFIHRQLEMYRRRFERGDRMALLLALDVWLSCCQGPPAWIADAFFHNMTEWLVYRATTLDEAFGAPSRAGKHIDRRREREELRPRIMLEIARLIQQGAPTDRRTFGQVGEEINKGASYVEAMYYEPKSAGWKRLLPYFSVERLPVKNPKK